MCPVVLFVVRTKLHRLAATTVVPFATAQQETPSLPRNKLPAKTDRLETFDRSIFAIILCCTLGFAVHCRAITIAITTPPNTFWEAETDLVVDVALGLLVHVVTTALVFDPTTRKQGPISGLGSGTTYNTTSSAGTMYDTTSSFRIIQSPLVNAFGPEEATSRPHIPNVFSSQLTIEALRPTSITSLAPPLASPSAPPSVPLPPQLPPNPTQARLILERSATTTTATTKRKAIYRNHRPHEGPHNCHHYYRNRQLEGMAMQPKIDQHEKNRISNMYVGAVRKSCNERSVKAI
jgi:hypothetical protein